MKIKRRRVGNIEVRSTENRQAPYQIICWQKNNYYYEKEQYERTEDPEFYREKDAPVGYGVIHESCFKNPESCYVVAEVVKRDDDEPDIKSIGRRPWDLSVTDRADFDEIINAVYKDYYDLGNEME